MQGNIIGQHEGIINFTIGQRKGIKISNKDPLYVVKLNAKKNEVIVGKKEFLVINKIYLKNLNILENFNKDYNNLFIKVRSTGKLIKAKAKIKDDRAEVVLQENETGVSPGQACVFYLKEKIGDRVLGGGWIVRADNKN